MTVSAIRKSPISASEIDDEHEGILLLLERLRTALVGSSQGGDGVPLCRELSIQVSAHFSHERRLMRSVRYPHLDWHERQHAAARAKLARLKRSVTNGAGEPLGQLDSLARWLDEHIHLSDRMLTAYVRNFERARSRDILG